MLLIVVLCCLYFYLTIENYYLLENIVPKRLTISVLLHRQTPAHVLCLLFLDIRLTDDVYMVNKTVPDNGDAVRQCTRCRRRVVKDGRQKIMRKHRNYSASQLASKNKIRLNQAWKLIRTCRLLTTVD